MAYAVAMSAGYIPGGMDPESDPKQWPAVQPEMNGVKARVTKRHCFLGARCLKIIREAYDNGIEMEVVRVPVHRFTELENDI